MNSIIMLQLILLFNIITLTLTNIISISTIHSIRYKKNNIKTPLLLKCKDYNLSEFFNRVNKMFIKSITKLSNDPDRLMFILLGLF
jgi:hypothetical protein